MDVAMRRMGGVERRLTEGDVSEGAGASAIEKKKKN
jgi:hypothetical protein